MVSHLISYLHARLTMEIVNLLLVTAMLLHLHRKLPQALEVSHLTALAAAQISSSVAGAPSETVVLSKVGAATLPPTAVTTAFLTLEHAVLPVTSPLMANVAPMARFV